MTINVSAKHIVIFILLLAVILLGYFNRETIKIGIDSLFSNNGEKTVNLALKYLNEQDLEQISKYFDTSYSINLFLVGKYSYFKIEKWKLKTLKKEKDKYWIQVYGSTINAFGMKLERKPIFIVRKKFSEWQISDSYGFVADAKLNNISDDSKSDMEKHELLEEAKQKVIIEDWSFGSSYSNSVEGKATIYNGSQIPVTNVKFHITYKNEYGKVVNTDYTYAIGSEPLKPGERKNIEWYTSNCNCYKCDKKCDKASVRLEFE
ncbi:MAG: hypothetical protein K9L86_06700 [Candidatus Omnitrophica bacterium]|nr:hypothetical protein [Candidatus Omnitrophota bacterium]